jgi:hypothetical protein
MPLWIRLPDIMEQVFGWRQCGSGCDAVVEWIWQETTETVPGCTQSSKGHPQASVLYLWVERKRPLRWMLSASIQPARERMEGPSIDDFDVRNQTWHVERSA